MAVIETWYNQDLQAPVQVQYLDGNVFSQDNLGNLIGVHIFDDGEPAVLSGNVSANVIRADGGTVVVTGTLTGNDCYIILPAAAYAIPGPISIIIKLSGGGSDTTLCAVVANVYQASTDAAVDPGTIIPSIQDLIDAINAAVGTIPVDYSLLSSSVNIQYNEKTFSISPNMYNKNGGELRQGYYGTSNGWTSSGGDSRLGTTHPIYLISGKTYKWPSNGYGLYGVNAKYAWKVQYPGNGDIIDMTNEGTINNGYYTVTINSTGWYVFNIDLSKKDSFMFCLADEYPNYYIGYNLARMAYDYPNVFLTFDSDGSAQYLSIAKKSANLFDKDSVLIQDTQYCSGWDWAQSSGDSRLGTTHPIYLKSGETYKWIGAKDIYGANNGSYLWRVTSPDNMTIISRKQGTFDANDEFVTWTCNEEGYWVVNINVQAKDSFMFCISSEYPNYYEAFGVYYAKNTLDYSNIHTVSYLPIAGKTLICDGDSIASATPDSPEGKGGWFGRLRDDQKIVGHNYAVGGASITYLSESRHCISRSIDDIYTDYEQIDFLILEGGTNDADLIGQFDGDTPPAGFGSWSADDFGGDYDDTTFCGAVESMFYKAINYWPDAHIGYIVPMEMGYNNSASINNRKRYFEEAAKIANKWHIPVLNLWDNSGADARLTAFYDSTLTNQQNIDAGKFYIDGQHPTSYGYNKMQPMIEAWVKGL